MRSHTFPQRRWLLQSCLAPTSPKYRRDGEAARRALWGPGLGYSPHRSAGTPRRDTGRGDACPLGVLTPGSICHQQSLSLVRRGSRLRAGPAEAPDKPGRQARMARSPLRGQQQADPSHRASMGPPSRAQPGPQHRSGRNRRESRESAENVLRPCGGRGVIQAHGDCHTHGDCHIHGGCHTR